MRLTLRTLLAYLDDILDPADARELGKKIEESEFASGLVHRIRGVTRKLRLGAPKLSGKGMGLDANTVAEYLDNTLPQDQVPDFEKVCLESDVQLAEVAACHQILTLVLGEPAEVDAALRERMRSLQTPSEPGDAPVEVVSPVGRTAVQEPAVPLEPPDVSPWDHAPEVPIVTTSSTRPADAGRSIRVLPVLGMFAVAFLLALVALMAVGRFDAQHPLLGRFFAQPDSTGAQAPPPQAGASQESAQQPAHRAAPADSAEPPGESDHAKGKSAEPPEEPAPPPAAPGQPPTEPDARAGGETPDADSAPVDAAPAEETGDAALAGQSGPEATAPDSRRPSAMNDPALMRSKLPPEDATSTAQAAAAAGDKDLEPLATYVSDQHVLVQYHVQKQAWLRLVANSPLSAGTRLVALPTYRPQILFASGVQMVVIGPAELQLAAPDADGVEGVVLHYGRLLVMPAPQEGSRLNIQFGARQSRVTFNDRDSTLALDGWRYHPLGADPQGRTANWVLHLFTPVGQLSWQDQGLAAPLVIESGRLATMVDTGTAEFTALAQLPDWLDASKEPPINLLGSKQLEPLLSPEQSLSITLREQANNRLVEVRSLAMRSLSQFDEFDACIAALNTGDLRYFWKDICESLRAAEARSPETAGLVHAAFLRLRGEEGARLDQLLWGFGPEQLAAGGAQTLVEALSSPSIDVRVLAFLNLSAITGKTHRFQPDREPRSQRAAVLSWERDLQQHGITFKTPPVAPPGAPDSPEEGSPATNPPDVP